MDRSGLTLIELLAVITLVVIVVGVTGMIFKSGLDSWMIGETETSLQQQSQRLMEEIIEGSDAVAGIREVLEVIEATPTSLVFVPFWIDHHSDYRNDSSEFILSREVKYGSCVPIGQLKLPQEKRFTSFPTVFSYGREHNPNFPDDKIKFINPIPVGSAVRILFYPDPALDASVIMKYYWDDKVKRVFRVYNNITEDIIKYDKKIKVVNFKFSYYDNLNNLLEPEGGRLSSIRRRKVLSAIGIDFTLEKVSAKRELSSFASIRTLGGNLGNGIALNEGLEFDIPDSQHIKTLVLDNLGGIEENGKLEIEISSALSPVWKIAIDFGLIDKEPHILGFNVEYPKGTNVYFSKNKRFAKGGLNLLRFGDDYYDYDDDPNVKDAVNIQGEGVKFRVTKMNIGAGAVFVRP